MKKLRLAALVLVAATVLGATVLREPVADAAAVPLSVFVTNDESQPGARSRARIPNRGDQPDRQRRDLG